MKVIEAILKEMLGLFVDDGRLAVGIVLVVLLAACFALLLNVPSLVTGGILLCGCALVLGENVLRTGRRS